MKIKATVIALTLAVTAPANANSLDEACNSTLVLMDSIYKWKEVKSEESTTNYMRSSASSEAMADLYEAMVEIVYSNDIQRMAEVKVYAACLEWANENIINRSTE